MAPSPPRVEVAGVVTPPKICPACRAVVPPGGSGTTAAGLRAGIPSLILWTAGDQPLWGSHIKQLKVGTSRRFSATTPETLVADLRKILAPEYLPRARELSSRMSKPADSAGRAGDLLEEFARSGRRLPRAEAARRRRSASVSAACRWPNPRPTRSR